MFTFARQRQRTLGVRAGLFRSIGQQQGLTQPDDVLRVPGRLARERGVTFDIGHGAGSFGFRACRGLLAAGFRPDVISSDVHVLNVDGPAFDLLTTLSKFLVLGVDRD